MVRWYSNRASQQKIAKPIVSVPTANVEKRPRATNAEALFAKSREVELREATKLKQEAEGVDTPGHNLVIYRDIKKNAYANLPAAEKEKWEALADEHNKTIKLPPSADHINK